MATSLAWATTSDLYAQSGRSAASAPRSGGAYGQSYSGGSQNRLPFSSSAGQRGSQSGRGRGGFGQGAGLAAGPMGSQLDGGQGPLNANLAQTGAERFQQDGFVGRDAQDVREGFQNAGRRGTGQTFDQMVENLNDMRDARRRWRAQNVPPPPVRVQLRPAFDVPPPLAQRAAANARTRLADIMQTAGVVSPQALVDGRTVILRGAVATEHDRALIGQLVALEPGVSRVENLLTIQTPPGPP